MSKGRHASYDGSFARSASTNVGRGVLLVLVAVAVGFALLETEGPSGQPAAATSSSATRAATKAASSASAARTGRAAAAKSTKARHRAKTSAHGAGASVPGGVTSIPPSRVKVLVANGTSVAGAAGRVSTSLHQAGFATLSPTNTSSSVQASAVYFMPGYDVEAATLAKVIGLGPSTVAPLPSPLPVSTTQGADVVVTVGPGLASRAGSPPTTTSG
ncbi:MAG: LytR C-terminal domain-containing protein [Acidimicrobiales bacterium]